MKLIPLSRGLSAKVDDADFEEVCRHKWYASTTGYAVRNALVDGRVTTVKMHRILTSAQPGLEVDHIDGDRLNNQRANLRPANRTENLRNSMKRGRTSRFKGVYWLTANGRWRAKIKADGRYVHLGLFDHEESAARAYDDAARTYFGEFARTNFT